MLTYTLMDWTAWSAMITGTHMIILLAIILLIFGPSRLPELSRALGRSIKDFKKGIGEIKDDLENADQPKAPPKVAVPPAQPAAPALPPVVASAPPPAAPAIPPAEPPPASDDMFPSDNPPPKN